MSLCYLGSFITVSWIFNENPGVALVFLTTGSSLGQVVMPYVIDVRNCAYTFILFVFMYIFNKEQWYASGSTLWLFLFSIYHYYLLERQEQLIVVVWCLFERKFGMISKKKKMRKRINIHVILFFFLTIKTKSPACIKISRSYLHYYDYYIQVFITEFDWSGAYMLLAGIALNCAACGILIHCSSGFFHKGENQDMESSFCNRICDKTLLTDPILLMTLLNVLLLATTGSIQITISITNSYSKKQLLVIKYTNFEMTTVFVYSSNYCRQKGECAFIFILY
jgi:hypothetical protein